MHERRCALITSAVLHVLAVTGLWIAPSLAHWLAILRPIDAAPQPITFVARAAWDSSPSADPLLEHAIELASNPPEKRPTAPNGAEDEEPGALTADSIVRRRVDQSIADARKLDAPEQLERLRGLTDELNEVSTPESLDQLTDQLQTFLGTKRRATQPAEKPVEGPFDTNTAQVHDVRRLERDDGTYRYVIVLLDSAGRQMETELTDAEGEQLYKTFELIKQNPLLEKVYRQVVMSLLDKMLDKPAPAKR